MKSKWIISCEHGGNQIPAAYASFFQEAAEVLQTHQGYDPGALDLFKLLAAELSDISIYSVTSRLLVELNRSLHHKNLFSAYTKKLPAATKKEIIEQHYLPYRKQLENKILEFSSKGNKVVHLSIHSFTPLLNGEVRKADIGLLYDPGRKEEREFCRIWKEQLQEALPTKVVRLNYPYLGTADGFTTFLRKQFPENYIGIEIELNQQHQQDKSIQQGILSSLLKVKALEKEQELR